MMSLYIEEKMDKGTFYVSIGFYKEKELGYMEMYDHITRAFRIEVVGTPIWNVRAYGYVKLDDRHF